MTAFATLHSLRNTGQRLLRTLVLAPVLLLGGCAAMTANECRTADWYEKGLADGERGQLRSYYDEIVIACQEAQVEPDRKRYMAGYDVGIREYCTPENGFEVGRRGGYYRDSCPVALAPAFMQQYRLGNAIYTASRKVDDLNRRLEDREDKLLRSKNEKEKIDLRREIRDLDYSLRRARDELFDAERQARRSAYR